MPDCKQVDNYPITSRERSQKGREIAAKGSSFIGRRLGVVDYSIVPIRLSFRAGPIEAMDGKAATVPGNLTEHIPSVAPATDQATRLDMLHGARGH
jgi:hypothetical protein